MVRVEVARSPFELTPARGRGERTMSLDRRARARGIAPLVAALLVTVCAHPAPPPRTVPAPAPDASRASAHEAQIDALQERLDDARQEVVRAMAKLQTLATRAEAASAIAEAEIALQPLQAAGTRAAPEYAQARRLLDQSTVEFNKSNYGGALYLASQAKSLAGVGKGRL